MIEVTLYVNQGLSIAILAVVLFVVIRGILGLIL